ncbi:MAG: NTP transferase domain-containing protein [Nitrospirae bacterium]|nr:NTP transferase domain-containing protein [Nitrospirota bacterium]
MGTRLQSVVCDVPKPLAIVGGVPFLDRILAQLSGFAFIKKVVLAVCYKSEMIIERYSSVNRYNFEIGFSVEERLLGTGGAIKKAVSYLSSDDVLVLNGDTFVDVDFDELLNFHNANNSILTMVLHKGDMSGRYGSVMLDTHNKIKAFSEKTLQRGSMINAGVYVIKKILFERIREGELSFERDMLPDIIKHGAYGYPVAGRFIDIGIPETYLLAGEYLKNNLVGKS